MQSYVLLWLLAGSGSTKVLGFAPTVHSSSVRLVRTAQDPLFLSSSVDSSELDQQDKKIESVEEVNGLYQYIPTKRTRFLAALPCLDTLDRRVMGTALPSMVNLAVVPLVNAVDTFWVGRMGIALSLAGQAAANNAFFTIYFLVAFLPTITAPMVAEAVGSGDTEAAQARVCESLFLCNVLGGIGTILLVGFPRLVGLRAILPDGAPALEYAAPYLRWRALSMVPALLSATGFAAYRGMLDTVTPLKVSLFTNALNLVLDPLLMFQAKLGFVGAALATAISEVFRRDDLLALASQEESRHLEETSQTPVLESPVAHLAGWIEHPGAAGCHQRGHHIGR